MATMWLTLTSSYPTVGPLTTLYCPAGRPLAYAAGVDDPCLVRIAARLNAPDGAPADHAPADTTTATGDDQ